MSRNEKLLKKDLVTLSMQGAVGLKPSLTEEHQTEPHLPHASVGATLARLEEDALFLQRILAELEQATRTIQRMCSSEDKLAIDQTVFWAAHTLGYC